MIRFISRCAYVVLLFSVFSAQVRGTDLEQSASTNRNAGECLLPVPFQLTSDEQKEIDRLLDRWEQWNGRVKTFDCRFKRWTYDAVFFSPIQPQYVDGGIIKYSAPNRILFRVDLTEKNGKSMPIDDNRLEHFVFTGNSVFEYNYRNKILVIRELPTFFEKNGFADGPLAFGAFNITLSWCFAGASLEPYPFGARAEGLKRYHYIRLISSPDRPDEIHLEAYPRSRQFACLHKKMELIFAASDMSPVALKIEQPNGTNRTVYAFFDCQINKKTSLRTAGDPFYPNIPFGWQRIVEEPPTAQARRPGEAK